MIEEEKYFNLIGAEIIDSIKSQMFGKPCYKIGKKAFTCYFNKCMVFKLEGESHQEALSLDGTELFDPSGKGRPMKQWVQVPFDYQEMWNKLAISAAEYVIEY